MEELCRNVHLVVESHVLHTLDVVAYSSVVTGETLCIALTMAILHDLEVKIANALNAYRMAPNREKIWIVLGPKFGDYFCKSAILSALYGLKSAGASVRTHLAQCVQELGYKSCDADPGPWINPDFGPEDKLKYYSYMLCYVDE